MYTEVLKGMHVLATCILILLACRLQEVCTRILMEVLR
jgi:hypothetical protein